MADYFLVMKEFVSEGTAILNHSEIENLVVKTIKVPINGIPIDRTYFLKYGDVYMSTLYVNDNDTPIHDFNTSPITVSQIDGQHFFPITNDMIGKNISINNTFVLSNGTDTVYGYIVSVNGNQVGFEYQTESEKDITTLTFTSFHLIQFPPLDEMTLLYEVVLHNEHPFVIPFFLPYMSETLGASKQIFIHTHHNCDIILLPRKQYRLNGLSVSKNFRMSLDHDGESTDTETYSVDLTYNGRKTWFTR